MTKIVLLSGVLAVPVFAEKVTFESLSPQLQEKIRTATGGARIEDIDRQTRDGKYVYEVGFKKNNGEHTELRFEEPVASATAKASSTVGSRKIEYSQLPEPVRRVADSYVRGGEVNDVDQHVRNGQVRYEIGYKPAEGGAQHELLLDESGNVLKSTSGQVAQTPPTRTPRTIQRNTVQARTIEYTDVPLSVRQVAEQYLRDGHVAQVQRQIQNGKIHYTIGFDRESGEYQQMVIAEDGQIISNGLIDKSAVGSPGAAVQSGTTTSPGLTQAAQYSYIENPVQLRNTVEVDGLEVPVQVQRVIRGQTENGKLREILRGEWAGKQVYQVAFTDSSNKYVELQVDAQGQIIYDPRSSDQGATPAANILNNLGRALFDRE